MMPALWRLLRTNPAPGAWNMGCDLALMDVAREESVGVLRLYGWSRPTVSFGRHERTAGLYSPELLADHGFEAVRRPTGGRALLHDRDITYSITLPIRDETPWQQAYYHVNTMLLEGLHALGVTQAAVVPANLRFDPATAPARDTVSDGTICFSTIAPGEIAVDGRKLVASAVWRERGAYLQQGSILLHDDQDGLAAVLGTRVAKPERAAALSDLLPTLPTTDDVLRAFAGALGKCGNVTHWSIPSHIVTRITTRSAELAEPSWLWRR